MSIGGSPVAVLEIGQPEAVHSPSWHDSGGAQGGADIASDMGVHLAREDASFRRQPHARIPSLPHGLREGRGFALGTQRNHRGKSADRRIAATRGSSP